MWNAISRVWLLGGLRDSSTNVITSCRMCFGTDFWIILRNSAPVLSSARTRNAWPYSAYTKSILLVPVENFFVLLTPIDVAVDVVALRALFGRWAGFMCNGGGVVGSGQQLTGRQEAKDDRATAAKQARRVRSQTCLIYQVKRTLFLTSLDMTVFVSVASVGRPVRLGAWVAVQGRKAARRATWQPFTAEIAHDTLDKDDNRHQPDARLGSFVEIGSDQ
eukprot:2858486-Prymnesium_polylepis.1